MTNVARFPLEKTRQPGEKPAQHKARLALEASLKLHKWDAQTLDDLAIGQMSMGTIAQLYELDDPVIIAAVAELDKALAALEQLENQPS